MSSSNGPLQNPVILAKLLTETLKSNSNKLENGENIDKKSLIKDLNETAQFLEKAFIAGRQQNNDKEEELLFTSEFDSELPENVQEWISSTFTMRTKIAQAPRKRLRSLVNAVRVGIFFERTFRKVSIPTHLMASEGVLNYLRQNLYNWDFDIFQLNELSNNHSLKVVGYELLHTNQLITRYCIDLHVLEAFLLRLEEGYSKHQNPYHNLIHAADITHTSFLMLSKSRLFNWVSDLELFAILISAMIHDFEHTGTTNNYHITTGSSLAMTYNDKSVLENYHLSAAFNVLRDDQYNILGSLTNQEYKEFRALVIDMVLSTDMSAHFNQVQTMKELVLVPENIQKQSIISFVLHSADISHPCKNWDLHEQWTLMVVEEFFRQGDIERDAGINCSPLCDRHSTLVPESQIGFINFIVEPCFKVLCDIMTAVQTIMGIDPLQNNHNDTSDDNVDDKSESNQSNDDLNNQSQSTTNQKLVEYEWSILLAQNKETWSKRAKKKSDMTPIEEQDEENSE